MIDFTYCKHGTFQMCCTYCQAESGDKQAKRFIKTGTRKNKQKPIVESSGLDDLFKKKNI